MDDFSIKVTIEVDDGCGKPFGGTAFANQGVSLPDALYVCRCALNSAGYHVDRLSAGCGDEQIRET